MLKNLIGPYRGASNPLKYGARPAISLTSSLHEFPRLSTHEDKIWHLPVLILFTNMPFHWIDRGFKATFTVRFEACPCSFDNSLE